MKKLNQKEQRDAWISINEGETKELLTFLKSKGVKWANGDEIIPEKDRKGYHFKLTNGCLAYVSAMCWKFNKERDEFVDLQGLKNLYKS